MTATLSLPIDKNSPVPLYYQLALVLEGAIHSGALAPGTRLDKELELASRLRIARVTVRSASLEPEGMEIRLLSDSCLSERSLPKMGARNRRRRTWRYSWLFRYPLPGL